MNLLIVDDEIAARQTITAQIEEFRPDLTIAGTAANVAEAAARLDEQPIDLLLLDINMPDGTGFDLINRIPEGKCPTVIFITSETDFTIEAIRCAAVDYLVKPVDLQDLLRALKRAETRAGEAHRTSIDVLTENVASPRSPTNRIGIPLENGTEFVPVGTILHCEGEDRATFIHRRDGPRITSSYSIGDFDKILAPYGFLRTHRSHLVNPQYITWVSRQGTSLRLTENREVPIGRRRSKDILAQLSIVGD